MAFFFRHYQATQAFLNLPLPARAKHVFLTLDLRANKSGVCWPSLSRLVRDTGWSRASIARDIAYLVRENLIERISTAGRVTHYRIIDPQRFLAHDQAHYEPISQTNPSPCETGTFCDPSPCEPTPPVNPSPCETQNNIRIEQQQQPTPPTPQRGAVVVSGSIPQRDPKPPTGATSESAASALNQPPAKDPLGATPSLSSTNAPAEASPAPTPDPPPLAIALPPDSLFAPYREQLENLAARHGLEKVLEYVDKLDWQYRQKEPPGKPIALLNKLLREGIITPEGYQTPQQREAERKRKELREAEGKAKEARQRQQEEARRLLRAHSDALFEALPQERKEPYLRQAAQGMPSFLAQGPWLEAEAERIFFEEVGARLARAALCMSDQDPAGEGPTGTNLCEGHLRHEDQTFWGAVPLRSPEEGEGRGRLRGTSPPAGLPE